MYTGSTFGVKGRSVGDGLEHLLKISRAAAADLKQRGMGGADVCLVLGSGFGAIPREMKNSHTFSYRDIPGMSVPGVEGHAGLLHWGTLGDTRVLVLDGRVHYYEGIAAEDIAYPLCLVRSLGVNEIIMTCASGGVSPRLDPGDILLVRDHVNLSWRSPLREMWVRGIGRFVDMVEPFDPGLMRRIERAAVDEGVPLSRGVLAALTGPGYETIAEIAALRNMGIDAVTMSSIPETIIANHIGLKTACISLITNTYSHVYRYESRDLSISPVEETGSSKSTGTASSENPTSGPGHRTTHREVLDAVERSAGKLTCLLKRAVHSK